MIAETDIALTVELYDSVDGLAVEVSGLPMCDLRPWVNQARQTEIAAARVKAEYPELLILGSQMSNGDTITFFVEPR